jgi:hypothetical protein
MMEFVNQRINVSLKIVKLVLLITLMLVQSVIMDLQQLKMGFAEPIPVRLE